MTLLPALKAPADLFNHIMNHNGDNEGIKNKGTDRACDEDMSEYYDESSDERNRVQDSENRDDQFLQVSAETDTDDEDVIVPGNRSRRSWTRSESGSNDLKTTDFRKRLKETESPTDLELLYPPSLWRESHHSTTDKSHNLLQDAFLNVPLQEEWREVVLEDFCIYNGLDHKRFPGQYESPHTVASEQGKRSYLLDGVLVYSDGKVSLHGLRIATVSIGGLDLDYHSCNQEIWVQTEQSALLNGWFRLQNPLTSYRSIWEGFYWVANFTKYCIDYLLLAERGGFSVTLQHFKSEFVQQISQKHGEDLEFKSWASKLQKHDMRRYMTQFGHFVYDQCHSIRILERFRKYPLWQQIGCFISRNIPDEEQTVVTRNTAATFLPSFPVWGASSHDLLLEVDCSDDIETKRIQRMKVLRLPNKFSMLQDDHFRIEHGARISKVQWTLTEAIRRNRTVKCPADILLNKLVVVRQYEGDQEYYDFALVISISGNKRTARVIWLTIPSSTICVSPKPGTHWTFDERRKEKASYPIGNELFFSDDCNCFAVRTCDIIAVHNISILDEYNDPDCEFFAVTKYLEVEQCFLKATKEDIRFMCRMLCPKVSVKMDGLPSDATRRRQRNSWSPRDTEHSVEDHKDETFTNISLFSGCGLLDRALESAGKLRTIYSIDCNSFAMCSAEANGRNDEEEPFSQEFIVDSVNTELLNIMTGKRSYISAACMSAGCPCPGFSIANMQKDSKRSQRNCTLLASTMSWIEVTLPAYVVIENVPNMDYGSPSACSQAISFLVALGYQVRKLQLKASDFGGCTVRKRLFIIAAAPSYELPDAPKPTHGNDGGLQPEVLIRHAISNLPLIHNDTLMNVQRPYHIPLERLTPNVTQAGINYRELLHRIPMTPPGQSLVTSLKFLTKEQRKWARKLHPAKLAKNSKAVGRIDPDDFFSTIVTSVHWRCANTGRLIHYNQDRVVSLEEVARAQGVPDDFVLVGPMSQKLRQVGNAVPWCLREAVGREIARAYQRSKPIENNVEASLKPESKLRSLQSIPQSALNGRDQILHQENNNDDDDDLVIGNKADFELASSMRNTTTSTANRTLTQSSTHHSRRPTSLTVNKTTSDSYSKAITSIEHETSTQTETRRSARIYKRSRSATDPDANVDGRNAKRRAKQLSMEAEMSQIGGSVEDDSDDGDADDSDELVVCMARLGSED